MTSHNLANLGNLAKIGQLKHEPPAQAEMDGLLMSGRRRLKDAGNASNAIKCWNTGGAMMNASRS